MKRRYRYSLETKQMVEVGAEWTDAERRAQTPTEELTYGHLTATDGTPLDTRRKHREYLEHHGLALADDYKETWEKASQRRKDFYAGRHAHEGLKEAIGRAVEQVRSRKK